MQNMTRSERETFFLEKANELQRIWKNPVEPNSDLSEVSDERLDELIKDTVGQIRFEKVLGAVWMLTKAAIFIFVALGAIGLLISGIKQLL
jgi:hypothetical protein